MTIYLDNNATTRPATQVVAAMTEALETRWANPSSTHGHGRSAARAVEGARRQVAALAGVSPKQVVFTSGATEANETVLRHHLDLGFDLVTSAAEHPAVTGCYGRQAPSRIHRVSLDTEGRWNLEALEAVLGSLRSPPIIGFAWANGETGIVQDAVRIAAMAARSGAACLVDATQAVGRIEIDGAGLATAYLSFSAHKLHGPKGVGVLVEPPAAKPLCLVVGGGQEDGRRGGTENVPGIVGMGVACELRARRLPSVVAQMKVLRDALERTVMAKLTDVRINGFGAERVANTSNITFAGVDGMALVARLEARSVLCSQVSACSSGMPEPSRTLLAMGRSTEDAFASVRFAVSVDNTASEIEVGSQVIVEEVRFLREVMGGLV